MEDSSQSQHSEASPQPTPGPWHRCEAQPDAIVGPRCTEPCRICDEPQLRLSSEPNLTYGDHFGGHFVCESVSSTANFNLIAAAPDLLAALDDLMAQFVEVYRGDGWVTDASYLRACAVIAKARP